MKIDFFNFLALSLFLLSFSPASRADDADPSDAPPAQTAVRSQNSPHAKNQTRALTEDEQDILDEGEISKGAYIGGGITGSIVGLGIGHAIEGRYLPLGLIFTAGEIGAYALMVAGITNCIDKSNFFNLSSSNASFQTCSTNSAFAIGLAGFVGLRVWEIIDLWVEPPIQNKRYRNVQERAGLTSTHFYFTPVTNGASASVNGGQFNVQFRF